MPTGQHDHGCEIIETFYGRCGSGVPEWQTDRLFQAQCFNKNNIIVDLWRAGQIRPRRGITKVEGSTVHFKGGVQEDFDVIVLCTGFDTIFPFLPAPYDKRAVQEHFKLMLADDTSLSFGGFGRPIVGSIQTISEMQSRTLAPMYAGKIPVPKQREEIIKRDQME